MFDLARIASLSVVVGSITACDQPSDNLPPDGALPACPVKPKPKLGAAADYTADGPTCPPWACGTNSPTVGDGVVFDSLDGAGIEPGANGIRILGATLPGSRGRPVRLHVEGDQLFATEIDDRSDAHTTYSGPGLVGLTLRVTSRPPGASSEVEYELTFEGVTYKADMNDPTPLTYWAYRIGDGMAQHEPVPYYDIRARRVDLSCTPASICTQDVATSEPIWAPVEHSALVFEGDHYDDQHDVTDVVAPTSWFNLACAGTAAAKMQLLRHSNAGAYSAGVRGYATSTAQRSAMLKMLTADYCGTGTAFTVDGQPLRYADVNHWYRYPDTPTIDPGGKIEPRGSLEALWNESGAICLDRPRRAAPTTLPGMTVSRADIDADCVAHARSVLPPCTGPDGALVPAFVPWEAHALVMSANVP